MIVLQIWLRLDRKRTESLFKPQLSKASLDVEVNMGHYILDAQ